MELTGAKRHGTAHVTMLLDRALLPLHALAVALRIKRWNVQVVVTVAHGYLFLAAVLSCLLTQCPLIVIVHDDWIAMDRHIHIFKYFLRPLFRWTLHRATSVLSVSDAMAEYLWRSFAVQSAVQWPATDNQVVSAMRRGGLDGYPLRIAFAGMIYGTVHQSLDYLVRYMQCTEENSLELHLYSNYGPEQCVAHGWDNPAVHPHEWVRQEHLQATLQQFDIVFLPVSFEPQARYYAQTSFPSKLADYLTVGRPILLLAPEDAAITRYARLHGFAEIVTELSPIHLAQAVERLRAGGDYVKAVVAAGLRVFHLNHDMQKQRTEFTDLVRTLAAANNSGNCAG